MLFLMNGNMNVKNRKKQGRSHFFLFYIQCRGSYESSHTMHNKGVRRQEGWEKEGQNSGEQRHEEICERERDGVGNMGNTRWTFQGLSGRKAGNLKEVGLGGLSGVEKIEDLDGG